MSTEYMDVHARLRHLELALPPAAKPNGSYGWGVLTGRLLFVSGQTWRQAGRTCEVGAVPVDVSVARAREAARHCAIACLAEAHALLGSLNAVRRVVRVTGYVRSSPNFDGQPTVVDGASDLFVEVFGDDGISARTPIGVAELPGGACVEIDAIFEVAERHKDD